MPSLDLAALREVCESVQGGGHTAQAWTFPCPRCEKPGRTLYVRKRDGRWQCFSGACGTERYRGGGLYGPGPERPLAAILGVQERDLRERFYGDAALREAVPHFGFPAGFYADQLVPEEEIDAPELRFPADYLPVGAPGAEPGLAYLEGRGVSTDTAARYGVRYSVLERRVVFPVSVGGRLLGWQARRIWDPAPGERSPKVVSTPGMPAVWMFSDRLVGAEDAVVGEGPFDGIAADPCGGNVAGMGCSRIGRAMLLSLRAYGVRRIFLALDPDAAAQTARLVRELCDLPVFQVVVPPAPCGPCGGRGVVDGKACLPCGGRGTKSRDLGDFCGRPDEVLELKAKARRVYAGTLFFHMRPQLGGLR